MEKINIGTTANDFTGDSLRAAMQKINANIEETVAPMLTIKADVAAFADLATTHPAPEFGWAARVTADGFIYSWNGFAWKNTGQKNGTVVQTTGTSTTDVMSQKAVNDNLTKYPYEIGVPFNQTFVAKNVHKWLVDAYFNFEVEQGFQYTFASINKETKKANLYKHTEGQPVSGNLYLVGEFQFYKIIDSNYYRGECEDLTDSFVIANFDILTETTSNIFYTDGFGLSKMLFKNGKALSTKATKIEKVQGSIIKELGEILSATFIGQNGATWQNDNSIFSGWGQLMGIAKNFDAVAIPIRGNHSITQPITEVTIKIRNTNRTGVVISEKKKTGLNIVANQEEIVVIQLNEVILNAADDLLFIEYNCNGLIDRLGYDGTPYVWIPADDISFSKFTYAINGVVASEQIPVGSTSYYSWNLWYGTYNANYALINEQINDIRARVEDVKIHLPDVIYAVVGDTLQLFFKGIIQAVNPYQYDILVTCNKGNKYPRYFQYTPILADVGETTFTITVKDNNRNTLANKTCRLITKAIVKQPDNLIRVASFGDSLTDAWITDQRVGVWPAEAYRRLTQSGGTPAGNELGNITFIGAKTTSGAGYFGVGGWKWDNYTTAGSPAYRFVVSGVSSLSIGATYTNNGNTFTIIEINVTGGSGNILCAVDDATPTPQASGTLTRASGTGDSIITFSLSALDSQNPLWDYQNNKMTFVPYANAYGSGGISVVYTLLSWNGHTAGKTDFSEELAQLKIFADTLHAEFPYAKLKVMGLQVPSVCGMGENYGATGSGYADGYGMVVTAFNLNKAYQQFANRTDYKEFVEYVDIASQLDSEFNNPSESRTVNIRSLVTERIDINGVHPWIEGFKQISDVVYRNFVANFCQ